MIYIYIYIIYLILFLISHIISNVFNIYKFITKEVIIMAATRRIKCIYCGKTTAYGSSTMGTPCRKSPNGHSWIEY